MKHFPDNIWCIVPAAGKGNRFGGVLPKQYHLLEAIPILQHTLQTLLSIPFKGLVVALHPEDSHWQAIPCFGDSRVESVAGGSERSLSVLACLEQMQGAAQPDDWVLVHDMARPCVLPGDIRKLIAEVIQSGSDGGLLVAALTDTIKQVENCRVKTTIDRDTLCAALTPQMFRYGALKETMRSLIARGASPTDEAGAMETVGARIICVAGRRDNIKVTRPEDLAIAGAIMHFQRTQGDRT